MTTDTTILYETKTARARITVPFRHDWAKVGDFVAGKLFPGFDPNRTDPVFDAIMKARADKEADKKFRTKSLSKAQKWA